MNLLVTGGCGFIGSHFVAYILKKYPKAFVTNLDAMTYAAHPDTAKYLEGIDPKRYRFVKGDITTTAVREQLEADRFTAIVNFAAESHVDRSILDPMSFVTTNVLGVQNILTAAKACGNIRLVHVSTDEVYGSLEPGESAFTEDHTLSPNSPYAASKAAADLMAMASHRTFNQELLITRCSNNFGPFQFPEKLIPLLIANALEEVPIPVYGDGKQVRDWIYVEDHCNGIDAVLQKGVAGRIYNISASEERHNIDIVKLVLDRLKKPHTLIRHVGDRPAHDRRYALDSTRIRKELGWAPDYSFEDGLKKTIEWYLANEGWWKKVRNKDYFKFYGANYDNKFKSEGRST